MTITIDRAGRIIIPKHLRDALNLGPGAGIDIEADAGGLRLRVAGQTPRLVSKKGFLVHQGSGKADVDVAGFINSQREARATGAVRTR